MHGVPRSGDTAPHRLLTVHIQHVPRLRCPQRSIIIIIIITIATIISIVMCHLIATSSNLHAAAMALCEVWLLRGHPSMYMVARRQALVRGRKRAAALARRWASDERNWYSDDSPCWVKCGLANPGSQYERPQTHLSTTRFAFSMVRVVQESTIIDGRVSTIDYIQEVRPWVNAHRTPREMRRLSMHTRSFSR